MPPSNFYFGGGAADTVMHPLSLVLMIIAVCMILIARRKNLIAPFLICAFLIPVGQMVVLGGVHLFVLRIILLFAIGRLIFERLSKRTRIFRPKFGSLDTIFVVWAIVRAAAFVLLFSFQSAAIVRETAILLDVLGAYLFLRFLIQNEEDIRIAIKVIAVVAAVVGICMVNEKLRSQNVFGYLGSFPVAPQVRDGAIRAMGPFAHPLLAGSFGATSVPLLLWLWERGKGKFLAVAGWIGCTCMVICAASSTPLLAYVAGITAILFWPMRKHMRVFRWGIVLGLIILHLVMKAPVWFLIARVDLTGASSSYHRAMLVDTFIRHFNEWWLFGTKGNESWGADMWDTSNQFIDEGVRGGIAAFICFIALICKAYGKIGMAIKTGKEDPHHKWLLWLLGASLTSHLVAFWGVTYFDHTQVVWFALFAIISAATTTRTPNWNQQLPNRGTPSPLRVRSSDARFPTRVDAIV